MRYIVNRRLAWVPIRDPHLACTQVHRDRQDRPVLLQAWQLGVGVGVDAVLRKGHINPRIVTRCCFEVDRLSFRCIRERPGYGSVALSANGQS